MIETLEEPELAQAASLGVVINSADSPARNIVAVFPSIDEMRWVEGWLHPDGSVTDEPCDTTASARI